MVSDSVSVKALLLLKGKLCNVPTERWDVPSLSQNDQNYSALTVANLSTIKDVEGIMSQK